MNLWYKHESGYAVEFLFVANQSAKDGRQPLAVYRVLKTNEIFTESLDIFSKEYTLIDQDKEDSQLNNIDFIA